MQKAAILAFPLFLAFTAAEPTTPPLRHDFDTALPNDEKSGWSLLPYRLPEAFDLTARQLVRKTPISRHATLTVERYLERPEDGTLIQLSTCRSPYDDQPFRVPVSYLATHWFVVSDGPNTAVKRLAFSDRKHAYIEMAYMEETQEPLYPIAAAQK